VNGAGLNITEAMLAVVNNPDLRTAPTAPGHRACADI
jgi:hypothetical protein